MIMSRRLTIHCDLLRQSNSTSNNMTTLCHRFGQYQDGITDLVPSQRGFIRTYNMSDAYVNPMLHQNPLRCHMFISDAHGICN